MAYGTARSWSQHVSRPGSALALTWYARAGAQLPEKHEPRLDKAKDLLRALCERPAQGRTTALGRRVEKPGECKPGGPSGQKDGAKGDANHANK
jgi:hypothetical protein